MKLGTIDGLLYRRGYLLSVKEAPPFIVADNTIN
jgi:hypothetical protein